MTDRELLELLVEKVTKLEDAQRETSERLTRVEDAQRETSERLTRVEEAQHKTSIELENTISKSIQVLYEAHQMNADRFDRYDFDSISRNADIAATLAKITHDWVKDQLKAS